MIANHIGVQGDVSSSRLPADAFPAIFAYSLNRKLRAGYTGDFFKFRQADGVTGDYPTDTPDLSQKVYVEKIYDQKAKHGVAVQDAVQLDTALQPELTLGHTLSVGSKVRIIRSTHPHFGSVGVVTSLGEVGFAMDHSVPKDGIREIDGGVNYSAKGVAWEMATPDHYRINFSENEYMEISNLASEVGESFTITCLGKCNNISPCLGIWGATTEITIEPSEVTRFTFNQDVGALLENSAGQPLIYNSRTTPVNKKEISITGLESDGMTVDNLDTNFTNISIGRSDDRKYTGYFVEATMHTGELTDLGREQILKSTRNYYL
tara:strand:+ start:23868 stop:24827 length:960 start_codon:yes stop_codon:yes gene_type:complete